MLVLSAMLLVAMVAGVAQAKGKPVGKGGGKHKNPVVTYVFKGDLASVNDGSLTVNVKRGNKFAKPFAGQQVEFSVSDSTKIVKDDAPATLTDLSSGDKVVVQSRAPKNGATSFAARMIVAESTATADSYSTTR